MASQDVIHSFFVPAFRIKHDVVPGRYQTAVVRGRAARHLPSVLRRILRHRPLAHDRPHRGATAADYAAWLPRQDPSEIARQRRRALFRELGCSGCHGAGSVVRVAVRWKASTEARSRCRTATVVTPTNATSATSSCCPNSEVVAGYAPAMPSFAGQIGEDDLVQLVAYIKSLASRHAGAKTAPTDGTPTT